MTERIKYEKKRINIEKITRRRDSQNGAVTIVFRLACPNSAESQTVVQSRTATHVMIK